MFGLRKLAMAAAAAAALLTPLAASAQDARAALIGCYTYSTADLRVALDALGAGGFGPLDWVEERGLAEGPEAFADLVSGRAAAPKILLRPN